jgi:hypothetical protein
MCSPPAWFLPSGSNWCSSLVIDNLRAQLPTKTGDEAVLFYYFDYKDQANQSLEMFARSILRQLLSAAHHIPQEVQTIYENCAKGSGRLDVSSLSRVLESCATSFATIYLILDALDEFEQKHLKKLVLFLCQLKHGQKARFKIFCTTRPHLSDLVDDLKAFATLEVQPDNPDVEHYIKWRLDEEWEHDEDLKEDAIRALMGQKDIEYGPRCLLPTLRFLFVLTFKVPAGEISTRPDSQ